MEEKISETPMSGMNATHLPLRFFACGPAEAGTTTLIETLLDAGQLEAGQSPSSAVDLDAACRCFSTAKRSFIVADAPPYQTYPRYDLAIIVVDAPAGIVSETRRQAILASFMGVRHLVLAINKMDLVAFDELTFSRLAREFRDFLSPLGFLTVHAVPVCAREGDAISASSARMPWYSDPPLLPYLETIDAIGDRGSKPFRMPVERIGDSGSGAQALVGSIASGTVRVGDDIAASPSRRTSRVKHIFAAGSPSETATAGHAIMLELTDDIGVARGDVLSAPEFPLQVADQFNAHLAWMSTDTLFPGRSYLVKINHVLVPATVTALKYRLDVDTLSHIAAKTLSKNEFGVCNFSLARKVAFDSFADNRDSGSFLVLDHTTHQPLAAGMIDFALRRSGNLRRQELAVAKDARARLMQQTPLVLWFTGLSAAGKSTIANLVEEGLHARGVHTTMLDGDNVRLGLNRDLGFTEADRVENIRRVGEVAKLMVDAGLVVLCAFISPFRTERQMVRDLIGGDAFVEIFVDTPLETCIARDPKGLYRRAVAGEIQNFTGISQPYEAPEACEVHLKAGSANPDDLAEQVVRYVLERGAS